jgi:mannosylglycerate hydrolase
MEWHATESTFNHRLLPGMDQILTELEQGRIPAFTFDGQTVALENYLQMRPEKAKRIRKLVQAGKLSIGPWYVLPDEFLVSGESLIRNLQTGRKIAESFGEKRYVGYLPDTFGHAADVPMILKHFGIDKAIVWRGMSPGTPYFSWKSRSGDAVMAYHLGPDGYAQTFMNKNFLPLESRKEEFERWLGRMLEKVKMPGSWPILFPMGFDHVFPTRQAVKDTQKIAPDVQVVTMAGFMDKAATLLKNQQLPEVSGELRQTGLIPIVPGVLSARQYLKQKNRQLEWRLTRQLEQLITWQKMLGLQPRYEKELEAQWKTLLKNHPHDSICGCSIDEVHRENEVRFQKVDDYTRAMVQDAHVILRRHLQPNDAALLINLSDHPYTGVIEIERDYPLTDVKTGKQRQLSPPLPNSQVVSEEWQPFRIEDQRHTAFDALAPGTKERRRSLIWVSNLPAHGVMQVRQTEAAPDTVEGGPGSLENGRLRIEVDRQTGSLKIKDKSRGKEYLKAHELWRNLEHGDSYNGSPEPDNLSERTVLENVEQAVQGPLRGALKLKYRFPKIDMPVETTVSLDAGSDQIQFETRFINRFMNTNEFGKQDGHRIQAVFHTPEAIREVTAEGHFSPLKRQYNPNFKLEQYHFAPGEIEKKVQCDPIQRFVGFSDQTLATEGLTEYEVEKNKLKLTLMRTFGLISHPHTGVREGIAGPVFSTPDAHCIGRPQAFRYSWAPGFSEADAFQQSERLYKAIYGFDRRDRTDYFEPGDENGPEPKRLPDGKLSLFSWDNPQVQASAFVPASETKNVWHLRLNNPTADIQSVHLNLPEHTGPLQLIDLNGKTLKILQECKLEIPPYQICTLRIQGIHPILKKPRNNQHSNEKGSLHKIQVNLRQ